MDERPVWVMPEWMEPYRELIGDTGSNPIEDLMNDYTTTAQVNLYRAAICISVKDQVALLYRLHAKGLLGNVRLEAALGALGELAHQGCVGHDDHPAGSPPCPYRTPAEFARKSIAEIGKLNG
jgi:hypothetical protein